MVVRFQVDPDFYDHPKSIGMSDAATALWVRAGSYSAAKLLDGFIAEHVLSTLSRTPEDASAELIARGLWRRVRGGFKFHQWDERNLTRARVESDRDYERTRKKRQRDEARKGARNPLENPPQGGKGQANDSDVPPGLRPGVPAMSAGTPVDVPGVSVSVSVSESVSGSGQARAAPSEPPAQCSDHEGDPDPPPCRRCKAAREAREQWARGRAAEAAARTQALARERAETSALAIAACRLCDDRGRFGALPCSHDPQQSDRAKAGAAAVRNRLAGIAGGDRCDKHPRQSREGCIHCHPEEAST